MAPKSASHSAGVQGVAASPDCAIVLHTLDVGIRCDQAACTAALKLSSLWKKSKHARILQQPLPAGNKHADLLEQSFSHAVILQAAIEECPGSLEAMDAFLAPVLDPNKAAATLAMLFVWLQQQPLELSNILTDRPSSAYPTALWTVCCHSLTGLLGLANSIKEVNSEHMRSIALQVGSTGIMAALPKFLGGLLSTAGACGLSVACKAISELLQLLFLLHVASSHAPSNAAAVGPALPDVLQLVQRCLALLPPSDALAAVPGKSSGSSNSTRSNSTSSNRTSSSTTGGSSSDESSLCAEMCTQLVNLQGVIALSHAVACKLPAAAAAGTRFVQHLGSSELAEALLQLLAGYTSRMHRQAAAATAQLQQQQQQQPGSIHMSCRPLRVYLKLLPRCAAQYQAAINSSFCTDNSEANGALTYLVQDLEQHLLAAASSGRASPAVSAEAVALTVELLHLVLGELERRMWQQQQQQEQKQQEPQQERRGQQQQQQPEQQGQQEQQDFPGLRQLATASTSLLGEQLKLLSGCRTVLQECGLQLLQVLTFMLQNQQPQRDAAAVLLLLLHAGGAKNDTLVDSISQQGLLCSACPLLTSLAAQHPVAYFTFIDTCTRAGLAAADIFAAAALLRYGLCQPLVSARALLADPAAVVAVSSAVASLMKLAAHFTREAGGAATAAAAGESATPAVAPAAAGASSRDSAMQHFPAALPNVVRAVLVPLYALPLGVLMRSQANSGSSSSRTGADGSTAAGSLCGLMISSSSSRSLRSQVAASAMSLTVLLARCLVVLADAHEAAAAAAGVTPAVLLARAVHASPSYDSGVGKVPLLVKPGRNPEHQWQSCQYEYVWVGQNLVCSLMHFSLHQPHLLFQPQQASAAAEGQQPRAVVAAEEQDAHAEVCVDVVAAAAAAASAGGASGSSSSHLQQQQGAAEWAYLLQLHQSRKLTAAVSAFDKKGPFCVIKAALANGQHMDELYKDTLQLCRVLAGAAPLPLLCNHPGCVNLSGVSEASVAVKVCGGCRARYCSPACQAAHWRQHKKACRRMAALGLVVGK